MGRSCLVFGCGSRAGGRHEIIMHRIPKILVRAKPERISLSIKRREAWIKWLTSTAEFENEEVTEAMLKYGSICGKHFISGKAATLEDKSNPDWVPSLYERQLPRETQGSTGISGDIDDICGEENTEVVGGEQDSEEFPEIQVTTNISGEGDTPRTRESSSQTSITSEDIEMKDSDLITLLNELKCLKAQVKKLSFGKISFKNDPARIKYFTGLPNYEVLISVFELVAPYIKCRQKSFSKFQRFVLTMMRLRLNLDFKHLAYQFNITPTTASTVFYSCLNVMFYRLKAFVVWPDREELQCRVPEPFVREFGKKVTVIIDCFEIAIECPSNALAQALCWSSYKQAYTVKYLIGITPQGAISFISEGWGGRTSDKYLTENCDLLRNLMPGDLVLADRGFTVQDSVRFHGAELKTPAFTRGKKQLHPFDIELSRKLANVRVHVERVIGVLRQKFVILSGKLPIGFLSNGTEVAKIDKIVTVCCALANLCPSVISME